jgi:hypothetical protein
MSAHRSKNSRGCAWAILFTIIVFVLIAYSLRAEAQEQPKIFGFVVNDWIGITKQIGWAPPWFDRDDEVLMFVKDDKRYYCMTDKATGKRAASAGRESIVQAFLSGEPDPIINPTVRPTLPEEWRVCFPGEDFPYPLAAGEPAMWSISCTGNPCTQVDWPLSLRNLAGPTTRGELCEKLPSQLPPPGDGYVWGIIPRLVSPKGLAPVTRCLER